MKQIKNEMPSKLLQLTPSQRQALKLTQIDLLKEFIRVCEENRLRYYLAYGSVIGAVRHGGFIPWDDDIDVYMPRADYDKMLNLPREAFGNHYFMQSYLTDKQYPLPFSKLCDTDTVFCHYESRRANFRKHVYLDVFPLDGVPKSRLAIMYRNFHRKMCICYAGRFLDNEHPKGYRLFLMLAAVYCLFRPVDKVMASLDKVNRRTSYDDADAVFASFVTYRTMKKSVFGTAPAVLTFEGISVNVPADYDAYLKFFYGDYMVCPPEDKRVPHHSCVAFDIPARKE